MALKATMTETPIKGGKNIRFDIPEHEDTPFLECKTAEFVSGKQVLECFRKWAMQYGDVRLER